MHRYFNRNLCTIILSNSHLLKSLQVQQYNRAFYHKLLKPHEVQLRKSFAVSISTSAKHNQEELSFGIAKITPKRAIVYTCKVCSTRQGPKYFTKTAYEEGIVLVAMGSEKMEGESGRKYTIYKKIEGGAYGIFKVKTADGSSYAMKDEAYSGLKHRELLLEVQILNQAKQNPEWEQRFPRLVDQGRQDARMFIGQSGLVQRFARQTEHRRNIGTEGGASTANTTGNWGSGRKTTTGSYSNTASKGGVNDPNLTAEFPQIEVNTIQRAILGFGSALMSILDPKRGDMIATMGETTVPNSLLKHIHQRMGRDMSGAELLRWKPRINEGTIDRNWLATLPDGTLGKEYLRFLDDLNTSPDARPPVHFLDVKEPELVYVMQRYRETHDFTHVLLQMRPNMLGEVTVKYFEAIQLGLPMCLAAAIFGAIRLGPIHRRQLLEQNLPWVVEQAVRGRFLLSLDWENRFEQKISDIQAECDIQPFIGIR